MKTTKDERRQIGNTGNASHKPTSPQIKRRSHVSHIIKVISRFYAARGCKHVTSRAMSRTVKTALHRWHETFLQVKRTPGWTSCSINTGPGCPAVRDGWQDPNIGADNTRAEVISPKRSSRVRNVIVLWQPSAKMRTKKRAALRK